MVPLGSPFVRPPGLGLWSSPLPVLRLFPQLPLFVSLSLPIALPVCPLHIAVGDEGPIIPGDTEETGRL